MLLDAKGRWFYAPKTDASGLSLTFGGPDEFLGQTPGVLRVPGRRMLRWYANEMDVSDVDLVLASPLRHRVSSVKVGRSSLTASLLRGLSGLSPAVRDISFTQCSNSGRPGTLSTMQLRLLAINDSSPRIVGELPYFVPSILLGSSTPLLDADIDHVASALPRSLFIRGPASAGAIALALRRDEIRFVEAWGRFEAADLLEALTKTAGSAGAAVVPRRIFKVRGDIKGRQVRLRECLAERRITLELVRPRRRT